MRAPARPPRMQIHPEERQRVAPRRAPGCDEVLEFARILRRIPMVALVAVGLCSTTAKTCQSTEVALQIRTDRLCGGQIEGLSVNKISLALEIKL